MIEKFVLEGTQVTLLEKLKNKQDLLPKQCLDMPIDELKTAYNKDARESMSLETKKEIHDGIGESNNILQEQLDHHAIDRITSVVESMNKDLDSETLEKYDFDSPKTICTRNEALEGQNHPETGVR